MESQTLGVSELKGPYDPGNSDTSRVVGLVFADAKAADLELLDLDLAELGAADGEAADAESADGEAADRGGADARAPIATAPRAWAPVSVPARTSGLKKATEPSLAIAATVARLA
jgi:hypothetical protein